MNKQKVVVTFLLIMSLGVFMTLAARAQDGEFAQVPEESHQMDWFIGEWEVASRYLVSTDPEEWVEDTVTSTIQPVVGGFALMETFKGTLTGLPIDGLSVRTYNSDLGKWEQRWIDNTGSVGFAEYTGEWNEEEGEFTGYSNRSFKPEDQGGRGEEAGTREIFFDIEEDRFSWRLEQSSDGGETWTTVWTLEYTRTM